MGAPVQGSRRMDQPKMFLGASNGQDIGNSGGEVQGMLEGKYGECISQHRHEFGPGNGRRSDDPGGNGVRVDPTQEDSNIPITGRRWTDGGAVRHRQFMEYAIRNPEQSTKGRRPGGCHRVQRRLVRWLPLATVRAARQRAGVRRR